MLCLHWVWWFTGPHSPLAIYRVGTGTGLPECTYLCKRLMPLSLSDIVGVPVIFETVLCFLQCTKTYARLNQCDRTLNSFLQSELRTEEGCLVKFDTPGRKGPPTTNPTCSYKQWIRSRTYRDVIGRTQPPSVGSETPTPPVPRREGEPTV